MTGENKRPRPPRAPRRSKSSAKVAKKYIDQLRGKIVDPETEDDNNNLRRLAGLVYQTAPSAISIRDISEQPPFVDHVSIKTLEEWSREDQWIQKRHDHFKAIDETLKNKILTAQIRSNVSAIREIENANSILDEQIERARVNTLEGAINAKIKLIKLRLELQDRVAAEVMPKKAKRILGTEGKAIVPKLKKEEIMAMAYKVIEMRTRDNQLKTEQLANQSLADDDANILDMPDPAEESDDA